MTKGEDYRCMIGKPKPYHFTTLRALRVHITGGYTAPDLAGLPPKLPMPRNAYIRQLRIPANVVPHSGQTNNMIGIKLADYRKKIGNDFLIRLMIERVCMTLGKSGINHILRQKMI